MSEHVANKRRPSVRRVVAFCALSGAVYAFNDSKLAGWPPTGFTLRWFGEAAANPSIRAAFSNSLVAAASATAIALLLGTLAALAVQRHEFFGKNGISFLFVLPIALPGVVTGIALQSSFKLFGVSLGLPTIVVAHATFCVVVAYNNVVARLRRLPQSISSPRPMRPGSWGLPRRMSSAALRRGTSRPRRSALRSGSPAPRSRSS